MSAEYFRTSLSLVLAHEGGYVNHPKDPGGATNQGITQKVYDAYCDYYKMPRKSVRYIKTSEVSEIYNKNYWKLIRGDSLPLGVDYAVFDFAVNSGVSRAIKYLQRLLGVDDDGVIGLMTLAAVEARCQPVCEKVIAQYCANRLAFLRNLETFPTFGKGWTRRVIGSKPGAQSNDYGVLDYATFMARSLPAVEMPKAIGEKPDEIPGKAIAPVDTFVVAPVVSSVLDVKRLALENDNLAALIAAS